MKKQAWKPSELGMVYCEHPDWPKPEFTIPLGKYTLWPCLQCWRQIKAAAVEDLMEPYLKNMAIEIAKDIRNKLMDDEQGQE